ncbi:MAG: heat-inducible transcription repressor HrcA [Deltaproteobacteria bacterium]|nr:heat-inducible transcription repressor HrcA [Deltaproteobacteria bacterium]MBW2359824.1 heat-inducible transcription repressor HrcA [Deltaproteobacteria bacterium]
MRVSWRECATGSEMISERQAAVLRAVVASYVGAAAPVGSQMIAHLLPVALSAASVRNTLAQLTQLGLVEKPHRSSGRVPTEAGLRVFVDELLAPADLPRSEQRDIDYEFETAEGEGIVAAASRMLSQHTRQLGFVSAPRVDRAVLRHVSLVRVASDRLLVVLVTDTGVVRRAIAADPDLDQTRLDRMATLLSERVAGRTLKDVRERLECEARELRREANALLAKALELGCRALAATGSEPADLIIETHLMLLEQPEFSDPRRLRDLFEALETKTGLLDVLDEVLDLDGVSVAIGEELDDPALRRCALVASHYGGGGGRAPLGVLGVIGPSRMDFARVIPLVEYLSQSVTGKLVS